MKTVQLAIHNSAFACSVRALLLKDENCEVIVADRPDLDLDGIILMDEDIFDALHYTASDADRFVIIASRNSVGLERMWNAGIHHVVFEEDPPATVHLAIVAALLRTALHQSPLGTEWRGLGVSHSLLQDGLEVRRSRPC
jgi:hypothetical protein